MKVLLVEYGGQGGVAQYAQLLTQALNDHPATVARLLTARDYAPVSQTGATYVRPVIHWYRGRGWGRLRKPLNALLHLWFLFWLPLYCKRERAEVVHIQGSYVPLLNLFAASWLKVWRSRVIWTPHNTFLRAGTSLEVWAFRTQLKICDHIIVHTHYDAQVLSDLYLDPAKVSVIPHGQFDSFIGTTPSRHATRAKLGIAADAHVLLFLGQIRPDKGLDMLAEAILQIGDGLVLIVAGSDLGGMLPAQAALDQLRQAGRAILDIGYLPMQRMVDYLAAADGVAMPYRRGSDSGILRLAYGAERPVLVARVGGVWEHVKDGETGWVIPEPTTEAVLSTIRGFLAATPVDRQAMGKAAKEYAKLHFDWQPIATRTRQTYQASTK